MKKPLCCLLVLIFLSGCAGSGSASDTEITSASGSTSVSENVGSPAFDTGGSTVFYSSQDISSNVSSEPEKELSEDDKTVIRYLEEAMYGTLLVTVGQKHYPPICAKFPGKSYESASFTSDGRFMLCENRILSVDAGVSKRFTVVDLWSGREFEPQDTLVSWSESALLSDNLIGCADGHVVDLLTKDRAPLRLYDIFFEAQDIFLQFDYGKTIHLDKFFCEIPENGPLSIGYDSEAEEYIVSYAKDKGINAERWHPYYPNRIGIAVFDKTGKEVSNVLLPEEYMAAYFASGYETQDIVGGLSDSPLTVLPNGYILMQALTNDGNTGIILLIESKTGKVQEIPYDYFEGHRLVTSPDGKYLYTRDGKGRKVIVKIENGTAEADEALTGSLRAWEKESGKDIAAVLFGPDNRLYFSAGAPEDPYPVMYRLEDDGSAARLFPLPSLYSLLDVAEDGDIRFLVPGWSGWIGSYTAYIDDIKGQYQ